MALPNIIAKSLFPVGGLAPLGPPPGLPPSGPPPGGKAAAPGGGGIPFTMYLQEQSNWCWSAVSVSVAQYYNPGTPWKSQCDLASAELGLTCCPAGSTPGCNVPWYLDQALTRTNNYKTYAAGAATTAQIQSELGLLRPLGVRIAWSGGGAHFVILSDYFSSASIDYVTVEDPIFAQSTLTYAAFCSAYQGSGSWSHSYWTHP